MEVDACIPWLPSRGSPWRYHEAPPSPMTPLVLVVAVAITAAVSAIIVRAIAGRQLAETRAALAAQLASIEQDNKWLRDEVERHKQSLGSTRELLDRTDA